MGEILGNLIAGIGIFFVGLRLITAGFKEMTGRRLRMLFARWTDKRWRAALTGLLCGFVSQSMSAVSFILAGLVGTGIMSLRRAMPVIFWANAGAGLLVLIAVLDLKIFIFFVLGLAGLSFAFEKPARYHPLAEVLLGIGLLFYGLVLIRAGAAPLAETKWFQTALLHVQTSFFLEFLVSALLTAVAQSSSAVTILAITFTQSGLLNVELMNITRDRSEILRAMRQNYLAKQSGLTSEGRQLFLRVTGLFETTVWILGRMAQLQHRALLMEET